MKAYSVSKAKGEIEIALRMLDNPFTPHSDVQRHLKVALGALNE